MVSLYTDRRRSTMPSLSVLIPLLLVVFTSTASAASAVLGIDLGTNFIKAAIVKPGTPLDIVLTKDSKRKEASVVAFKPDRKGPVELGHFPERLYGSDALALGGRFPGDVYTHLKPLLGLAPSDASVVQDYQASHPAVKLHSAGKQGTSLIQSGAFSDNEQPWSVEELLGMELRNIRTNAEAMVGKGSTITEAVITIPLFYTTDERRAVERAAKLAGINLMGLVSDGLAIGIDYSVKREFPNVSKGGKPEVHMIFDMGASSTTATVLRFQAREVKDVGRYNKTVQEVSVLGSGWDRTLGGNAINGLIVDYMVDEFMKLSEVTAAGISAADVKSHGRTSSKLWREAERARQVLSANSDVRMSFEGLYNDIDFKTTLSRADFEKLAAAFSTRVEEPFNQAMDAAKLSVKDLDSIIIFGGTTRTPFVQKRLETIAGKSTEVRSNVNADEAAAFGAAFKAAGLSPSFKVKEIRDAEAAVYAAGINYPQDSKQRQQKVFVPTSLMGNVKQLNFKEKDDFTFDLFQHVNGEDRSIGSLQTLNLTASVAALNEKFGCSKDDISTKFTLRLSPYNNIPEIVSGTVSCEVEGTGKTGGIGDSVKGLFGFGSKKGGQEPLKEGEDDGSTTEEVSSGASTSKTATENASASGSTAKDTKPKKRTEIINIDFSTSQAGLPQPSAEETTRMKERLAAFDRSDKAKVQREEALNVLEAFTYRARDLLSDVGFEAASTETVRDQLTSLLGTTSEWLYGEGSSATTEILKSKLTDLKDLVDPIQSRRQETSTRPEKLKLLDDALDQTKSLMTGIKDQLKKAEEQSSSAAAASSASTTASPSASDDLDDLEEPDVSSSSASAKPAPVVAFSYTEDDLTKISDAYDSVSQWVEEKKAAQDKLAIYEDPAFTVKEIQTKAEELNRVMMVLLQKKMQAPKKSSSSKKPKSSTKSKKAKSSSSGSDTTAASSGTASKSSSGKPAFTTINPGEDMPSEEEILRMIRQAKGGEDDESGSTRDEL